MDPCRSRQQDQVRHGVTMPLMHSPVALQLVSSLLEVLDHDRTYLMFSIYEHEHLLFNSPILSTVDR
jgi:hypothetical protein